MALDMASLLQNSLNSRMTMMLAKNMYGTNNPGGVPDSNLRAFNARMRADGRVALQAAQNMEEAASMMSVAQNDVTAIKQKLKEMVELSSEGALRDLTTESDFVTLQRQLQKASNEILDIARDSEFNGMKLMDGSAGMNGDGVVHLQAGDSTKEQVLVKMIFAEGDRGAYQDATVWGGDTPLHDDGTVDFLLFRDRFKDGEADDITANQTDVEGMRERAFQTRDRIQLMLDRVTDIEAKYSYDIKALNNLSVLFQSQADIFDDVWQRNQTQKPGTNQDSTEDSASASGTSWLKDSGGAQSFSSADSWLKNSGIMSLTS